MCHGPSGFQGKGHLQLLCSEASEWEGKGLTHPAPPSPSHNTFCHNVGVCFSSSASSLEPPFILPLGSLTHLSWMDSVPSYHPQAFSIGQLHLPCHPPPASELCAQFCLQLYVLCSHWPASAGRQPQVNWRVSWQGCGCKATVFREISSPGPAAGPKHYVLGGPLYL